MTCPSCGTSLPEEARFCLSCGSRVRPHPSQGAQAPPVQSSISSGANPRASSASNSIGEDLKNKLLDFYINFSISKELSDWLQELGETPNGTIEQKIARVRQHADSLVLPAESSARQTIFYLSQYDATILSEVCQELGLNNEEPKETLFNRIYHAVGRREGWLQPVPEDFQLFFKQVFLPILKGFDYEKEQDLDLWIEISGLLNEENLQFQSPPAHGSPLTAVLVPELLQEARASLLQAELKRKGLEL